MKTILKKWCETNSISISDAPTILKEYYKLIWNKDISDSEIDSILQVEQIFRAAVDWTYVLNCIAAKQTTCYIETLHDANHRLIARYYYEV